jgi:hypothetical protein
LPRGLFFSLAFAIVVLCLLALTSAALTLLSRRGPLLRGFALDVVMKDGRSAGRARVLLRIAAVWFAPLMAVLAAVLATRVSTAILATFLAIAGLASCALALGSLITNVLTPSRGLAERLSGTYLVPE